VRRPSRRVGRSQSWRRLSGSIIARLRETGAAAAEGSLVSATRPAARPGNASSARCRFSRSRASTASVARRSKAPCDRRTTQPRPRATDQACRSYHTRVRWIRPRSWISVLTSITSMAAEATWNANTSIQPGPFRPSISTSVSTIQPRCRRWDATCATQRAWTRSRWRARSARYGASNVSRIVPPRAVAICWISSRPSPAGCSRSSREIAVWAIAALRPSSRCDHPMACLASRTMRPASTERFETLPREVRPITLCS
jgi:hypothetical protein